MITETLSSLTEPTKGMLEPVQRLNQAAVVTVEKLAEHQIDSLKAYSDLGVSQLKVAAEVRDVKGLQNLVSKQTDVLRRFGECLTSDFRAFLELGADFVSHTKKIGLEAAPALPQKIQPKAD